MAEQTPISHDVTKLTDRIKDIRIAMFTTVDAQGHLHSRPMYTHEPDADGTLWFFTGKDSPKINELKQDSHVNLGYANPDDNLYVSITGTCRQVDDRQKIHELWSEPMRGWFPKGVDDPNIALLRVEIESGEFWDSPSSFLVQAYAYMKAVTTGQPTEVGPQEHARVEVK